MTVRISFQARRGWSVRRRPRETEAGSWERARAWRAAGVRDAEIARRLGVSQSTVLRGLGRSRGQETLPPAPQPEPAAAEPGPAEPGPAEAGGAGGTGPAEPGTRPPAAGLRPAAVWSRYAGAMLLHAFLARAGAGTVLAAAGGEPPDVAMLTAVSMCFALGAATTEQFKHLAAAGAGPLAGLGALPGLRALRPELARIADRTDPLALQQLFASAMLAADPVTSGCTTSMTTSWSLSNSVCKLGQSLSFCYITNITAGSFRRQGQTGTRSGNVTANAFMAAFQPSVPVPRCPLSRTSPSPSMWRPVTFLIPR